ncbi:DUF6969 family protein [Sphingomicrobium clamense]|uniref:DUF6969 domain-containing protein n=1 Tax=Sphingomicrobium clamense TaxID=2851013 RepID=A0ABS6V2X4_9SPHN|nr:hypothetical protein [Sphingomicrobium sp. B8]MBW0143816.1 hypothetical protein [Sphingomicrobium sp. B8]
MLDEREAGRIVVETVTQMAREQRPLMMRVLPEGPPRYWKHFPEKDARDARTKARWYYHVHADGDRDADEHGHFHLFLHRTQIDPGAKPIAIPPQGEDARAKVVHLAGLSIDQVGIPRAWFMTNRHVTNEFMYPAETLIAHLSAYDVDETREDATVNRFLTAMVALYRDELAELIEERDAALDALGDDPERFEKGHDVLSHRKIDLDAKIGALGLF